MATLGAGLCMQWPVEEKELRARTVVASLIDLLEGAIIITVDSYVV